MDNLNNRTLLKSGEHSVIDEQEMEGTQLEIDMHGHREQLPADLRQVEN